MRCLIYLLMLSSISLAAPAPLPKAKCKPLNYPCPGVYKTRYNGVREILRLDRSGGFYWANQSQYASGNDYHWSGTWHWEPSTRTMRFQVWVSSQEQSEPMQGYVVLSEDMTGNFCKSDCKMGSVSLRRIYPSKGD